MDVNIVDTLDMININLRSARLPCIKVKGFHSTLKEALYISDM
jgi:hypothetical protein